MKNFRKLSALILSAAASSHPAGRLRRGPGGRTHHPRRECVRFVEETAPGDHARSQPRRNVGPGERPSEEKAESLREFRFTTGLGGANGDFLLTRTAA